MALWEAQQDVALQRLVVVINDGIFQLYHDNHPVAFCAMIWFWLYCNIVRIGRYRSLSNISTYEVWAIFGVIPI